MKGAARLDRRGGLGSLDGRKWRSVEVGRWGRRDSACDGTLQVVVLAQAGKMKGDQLATVWSHE